MGLAGFPGGGGQATYHGNLGAFTSVDVAGDTIKVHFTSDSSVRRSGWHIDTLEHASTVASGAEFVDLRGVGPQRFW